MAKTKEQILNEQRTFEEIMQMPSRLKLDTLNSLNTILQVTIPSNDSILSENQKWVSIWSDDDMEILKHKVLTIVRDI
jgi:hypothetical protein